MPSVKHTVLVTIPSLVHSARRLCADTELDSRAVNVHERARQTVNKRLNKVVTIENGSVSEGFATKA